MTAKTPLRQPFTPGLTAGQISELKTIQNLLALAWHRNKNQHRRSRWWAEFGVLRRALGRLMAAAQKGHEKGGREEIGLRIEFFREEVLARCWLAFSAVVADNQFAALGLMLIGTLAKISKVLGVEMECPFQLGVDNEETIGIQLDTLEAKESKESKENLGGGVDLGVILQREEFTKEMDSSAVAMIDSKPGGTEESGILKSEVGRLIPSLATPTPIVMTQKKRKKKKGDEFDELFSSLI